MSEMLLLVRIPLDYGVQVELRAPLPLPSLAWLASMEVQLLKALDEFRAPEPPEETP